MYPDIGRTRVTVDSLQLFENIGGHALDMVFIGLPIFSKIGDIFGFVP